MQCLNRWLSVTLQWSLLVVCPALANAWSIERSDVGPEAMPELIEPLASPFPMPVLDRPEIIGRTLRVEGPPHEGAIQPAIDALAAEGGGRVVVPAGVWPTGRVELKTGVELHLEQNAVLKFSGQIEDYLPPVFARYEGIEIMGLGGLVYARDAQRIALTGQGVLEGPDEGPVREARRGLVDQLVDPESPVTSRVFDGQEGRHYFRPYFVCPVGCHDVFIEGVTLRNGPMWNVVPIYCDRVVVRGVTIDSRGVVNGDGVNVDSSRNVLIEYCSTNTGDDCYAIKAGRNEDGLNVSRSSQNIVVRNCFAEGGYGGVTVGSETAGGVRNLHVHDCLFDGVSYGAYLKTRRPRAGGGEDLTIERVRIHSLKHAVFFDMIGSPMYVGALGERLPKRAVTRSTPYYRNVTLSDVVGDAGGDAIKIKGIPESPASDLRLERVRLRSKGFINLADVEGMIVQDSTFEPADPTLRLLDARGVRFEATEFRVSEGARIGVRLDGPDAQPPVFDDCKPEAVIPR